MLKKSFYSLFVCVLEGLVWAPGSSHGECLTVRDVCYQLFKPASSIAHSWAFCAISGGRQAGGKYDILKIMNTEPAMSDFLPKTDCYWVLFDQSMTAYVEKLRSSSSIISKTLGFLLEKLSVPALCYKDKKWQKVSMLFINQLYFLCEYDVQPIRVIPAMSSMKTRTTRNLRDSTMIVDSPLFDRKASSQTSCLHVCVEFTGCSVFNYNSVNNKCRGFQHGERICTRHHPDWEVWAVD